MMGIKCKRCGRRPKELKQAPFSETFFGTFFRTDADVVGSEKLVSVCPECMEKWEKLLKEKKHEFKTEMDRVKFYFISRCTVPERAVCKKHDCWGHVQCNGKVLCPRCKWEARKP